MYLSGLIMAGVLFTILRCMPNFNKFIKNVAYKAIDYNKENENIDESDLQLDNKELDLLKDTLSNNNSKTIKELINVLHLFAALFSWIGVFFIILGFNKYKKFNIKNI